MEKLLEQTKKNGEITIISSDVSKLNILNLWPVNASASTIMQANGIELREDKSYYMVCIQLSASKSWMLFKYESQPEAKRMYNALQHLRALCIKENDLFELKGERMTFEETVKYINDKISSYGYYSSWTIAATPEGKMSLPNNRQKIDLLKLKSVEVSEKTIMEENGIELKDGSFGLTIFIYPKRGHAIGLTHFVLQKDAQYVYKALQHLRSLCSK